MLRKNYDELDVDVDGMYFWEGKPFTGTAYELHDNTQVWSEVEMIEGMPNGEVREWFPSGKLKMEGYGKLGERESWSREWFENGTLKRESISENNRRIKELIWNEQGELISEYERPSSDKR